MDSSMHMNRGITFWSGLGVAMFLASLPASAADLLSIYDQAVVNDPASASQSHRLGGAGTPPGLAGLCRILCQLRHQPQLIARRSQEIFQAIPIPPSSQRSSKTAWWSVNLRHNVALATWVPLIRRPHWRAGRYSPISSCSRTRGTQYSRYCRQTGRGAGSARDAIYASRTGDRRFEVAYRIPTSRKPAPSATRGPAVISAKRALASALEQLRAIIGQKPASLNEPAEDMPLLEPNPSSEDEWVRVSMDQNATLISSRLAADIARENVSSAFGGHLPTIDLSASRSFSDNDGRAAAAIRTPAVSPPPPPVARRTTTSRSRSVQSPLFSGGWSHRGTSSEQQWIPQRAPSSALRAIPRAARDAYLGVLSEIARVRALKQAMESSRTALAASEAGNEVGTRTAIDVLNSRRALVLAQTEYSAAKYSYLNNLIQLQLAAGDLDRGTLEEINRWLTVPQPTP